MYTHLSHHTAYYCTPQTLAYMLPLLWECSVSGSCTARDLNLQSQSAESADGDGNGGGGEEEDDSGYDEGMFAPCAVVVAPTRELAVQVKVGRCEGVKV